MELQRTVSAGSSYGGKQTGGQERVNVNERNQDLKDENQNSDSITKGQEKPWMRMRISFRT
jgi:hypothetical protein